ncbi:MAG: YncE family protein [Actinomycetota bacterium]|nr:YncE family protein [Actinomycetota bacterium]
MKGLFARRVHFLGFGIPVVALIAVAVAGVLVVVVAAPRSEDTRPGLDVETIPVGDAPQAIGYGALGVWVAHGADETLQRVDAERGEPVELDALPGGVAVTEDAVWVGFIQGSKVARVDPSSESRGSVSKVSVGRTPQAVASDGRSLWVAAFDEGTIWKIDLVSGEVEGEPLRLPDAFPSAIAVGFGSIWVTDVVDDVLIRIDPESLSVSETIPVGDSPTGIAAGEGGVWVANFNDSTVSHIDPATNSEVGAPIVVGGQPSAIAAGDGYVWVARPDDDSIIRIDPEESEWTGEVFAVGDQPQAIAVGAGSVWVANQAEDTVTRLTPQR